MHNRSFSFFFLLLFGALLPMTGLSQQFDKWIQDLEATSDTNRLKEVMSEWHRKYEQSHLKEDLINEKLAYSFLLSRRKNYLERIEQLAWVLHTYPNLKNDQTAWINYHLGSTLAYYKVNQLAIDYADAAIETAKAISNRKVLHEAYRIKATVYFSEKKFNQALSIYRKAIQYSNPNHPAAFASDLNNIALCYYNLKKYQLALNYYQRGILLLQSHSLGNNKTVEYLMIGNAGTVYMDLGEYDLSRIYLEKELNYYRQHDPINSTLPTTLLEMIRLMKLTGETDRIPALAREAIVVIQKLKDEDTQLEVMKKLNQLADSYPVGMSQQELTNIYNEILIQHLDNMSTTQDAINRLLYTEKIRDLQLSVANEREALKTEQANQRFRTIAYVGLFILALIGLGTGIMIFRQRAEQARQNLLIQQQKEEMARRQQVILEHENNKQREHLGLLMTNIKIKQKTEADFLKKIKEFKRRKDSSFDQLINELQISVNNLMDIDRKMIDEDMPVLEQNQVFLDKLKLLHPNLTENELIYCNYFLSGLSAKEIGFLNNQSDVSVRVFKNKIKKKMGLERDILLDDYLASVNESDNDL